MSRPTKLVVATAAAGALALGVGLGIAGYAAADPTSSPSPSPSTSSSADPGHRGGPGDHRGPGRGMVDADLAKQLAEKLGVTEAEATEALKAIREANKPSADPTARPSADPTARPTRPDPAEREAELAAQLAEKLGVDEAKVTKAFEEIRAARQADRAAALKSRLDSAVEAGTLTRAEADAVTKAVEKGVIGGR
ncbi:MAG TPA: Clp protease N-terminal domain-containing protein [Microlunatus sp.]|nr:Clp protease N-terminal domain-containing protein [Microlunatus sp.]